MEKEKKKRKTREIGERVNDVASLLSNDDDDKAIARLKAEIAKREANKKAKVNKKVENLLKVVETVSYKKVLKEIAKATKDKYLLKALAEYQIEKNKENANFLENIQELLKTGEETDIRKVYTILNLDYDKIQKEIEDERLKEEEARKAEEEIAKIEGEENSDTEDENKEEKEEFSDDETDYVGGRY